MVTSVNANHVNNVAQSSTRGNENDYLLSVVEVGNNIQTSVSITSPSIQNFINELNEGQLETSREDIVKQLESLNDDDILNLTRWLTTTLAQSDVNNSKLLNLSSQLDRVVSKRISGDKSRFSDLDIGWEACLHFYQVKNRDTTIDAFAKNLLWKLQSLDNKNLVRLLFLLNVRRDPLPSFFVPLLESKFLQSMDSLTLKELFVGAAAFFKTQTRFRDATLLKRICERVLEADIAELDNLGLSTILKLLKNDHHKIVAPYVRRIISSFKASDVQKLSYMSCQHLCNASCTYLQFNKDVLQTSLEKITKKENGEVRLKDLAVILRSCYEFNYRPTDDIFNVLIEDVTQSLQKVVFPDHFMRFILYMVSFEVYPQDLISFLFEPNFLRHMDTRATFPVNRDLLIIHTILSLEKPDEWEGKLLSPNRYNICVQDLPRMSVESVLQDRHKDHLFKSVFRRLYEACQQTFGDRTIYSFVLPYSDKPRVVILPPGKTKKWFEDLPLTPGAYSNCLVFDIGNQSHYADVNSSRMRSFYTTQLRLLKILGFQVHKIHWTDFSKGSHAIEITLRNLKNAEGDKNE